MLILIFLSILFKKKKNCPQKEELSSVMSELQVESLLEVHGTVRARPDGQQNKVWSIKQSGPFCLKVRHIRIYVTVFCKQLGMLQTVSLHSSLLLVLKHWVRDWEYCCISRF